MSGIIATAHKPTSEMIVIERMAKPHTENRKLIRNVRLSFYKVETP